MLHLNEIYVKYLVKEFSLHWSPRSRTPPEEAIKNFLDRFQITPVNGRESITRLLRLEVIKLEKRHGRWRKRQSPSYLQMVDTLDRVQNKEPTAFGEIRAQMKGSRPSP